MKGEQLHLICAATATTVAVLQQPWEVSLYVYCSELCVRASWLVGACRTCTAAVVSAAALAAEQQQQ
jgi:hypothetical protein